MSSSASERRNARAAASAVPKLNPRYVRLESIDERSLTAAKKAAALRDYPYTASLYLGALGRGAPNGRTAGEARPGQAHNGSSTPLSQAPPTPSRMVRSASANGEVPWASALRANGTHERTATAPPQRDKPPACTEKHCKYVVGTMGHCGSIYEELTKQLLATGRWSHLSVRQRALTKTLYITETQRDLTGTNMHLLLGEKLPCERVIATRRVLARRFPSRIGEQVEAKPSVYASRSANSPGVRVPMGNGDDGEARVINFVENTRSITLKSAMVTTLLKFHNYNWSTLGDYLPMSFKLVPRQTGRDERHLLLQTAKGSKGGHYDPSINHMWIAKSSAGCHGDNIEIFDGDRQGLQKLLRFIDTQRDPQPWVAQQYLDRPLLYHKRKFDIRCWALLLRDGYEIYVHEELVMRTSSVPYSRESATANSLAGRLAHITNHCVQETSKTYAMFEESNELWREHLDGLVRYKGVLKTTKLKSEQYAHGHSPRPQEPSGGDVPYPSAPSSEARESPYPVREVHRGDSAAARRQASGGREDGVSITLDSYIIPQIHFIIRDTLLAVKALVPEEPPVPPTHTFQIFGYDFLIDEDLKVWLLEINGAPGGPDRLKPAIMKDTIELAVAPFFPGTMNLRTKRHSGYVRVYP